MNQSAAIPVVWRTVCDTAPSQKHCVEVALTTHRVRGADEEIRTYSWKGRTRLRRTYDQTLNGTCRGKSVVEVGAGLGVHALYFASRGCSVFAIEPEDSQRKLLEISRTRLKHPPLLKISNMAITSTSRKDVILSVPLEFPGLTHLASLRNDRVPKLRWEKRLVPAIQLDSMLGDRFTDALFLDVRNAEYAVVCSARGLLSRGLVRDLLINVDPSVTTISHARWLRSLVEALGFRAVPVHDAAEQWRWIEFTARRGPGVAHYRFHKLEAVRSCSQTCSCQPPPIHFAKRNLQKKSI